MSSSKPYFHFPADPDLHEAMRAAAEAEGISMSRWLHNTVRTRLEDEEQASALLERIAVNTERILKLLEGQ